MKQLTLVAFFAVLTLHSLPAKCQGMSRGLPQPPPSLQEPDAHSSDPAAAAALARIDLIEVQREADELARTAQSIPTDVGNIKKGMLPKDVLLKLKQIEKLSKRLRGELTP